MACHTGYSRCVRRVRKTAGRVKIQSKGVQQIRQKGAPNLIVYIMDINSVGLQLLTDYSGFPSENEESTLLKNLLLDKTVKPSYEIKERKLK